MKIKNLYLLFTIFIFSSCGPTIYKSDSLENSRDKMKTIAILPFLVSIDSKRLPKGMTIETLKESEEKTGYDMQNVAYTWFLQRQNEYSITFQDVDRSNAILKKANISYDSVALQDKGELCKLLGVDGIITGKSTFSKPMSEGAAIAMTVLVGFGGSTNKTSATLSIHDGKSALLWKYDYTENGGLGSSTELLTKRLMKNASRKFPYKNK